ncbi:hypothetical protein [Streptomyces sp. NPDC017260]|uniref:hypothetical protein n=1 Tax=unclassified Streptomyces TaxID=2593676 RepID=UPI00379D6FC2
MPQMSKVELYAAIRRDHRAGMKMRELERKYNVSWRTVKKAVGSVWPEPRNELPPRPTALNPYKPVIDEMLRTDLDAPRKQRHTITRILPTRALLASSVIVLSPSAPVNTNTTPDKGDTLAAGTQNQPQATALRRHSPPRSVSRASGR